MEVPPPRVRTLRRAWRFALVGALASLAVAVVGARSPNSEAILTAWVAKTVVS